MIVFHWDFFIFQKAFHVVIVMFCNFHGLKFLTWRNWPEPLQALVLCPQHHTYFLQVSQMCSGTNALTWHETSVVVAGRQTNAVEKDTKKNHLWLAMGCLSAPWYLRPHGFQSPHLLAGWHFATKEVAPNIATPVFFLWKRCGFCGFCGWAKT